MLTWNIYEVTAGDTPIVGVMFRGRIRKLCLEKEIDVLVENAHDQPKVRFAVLVGTDMYFIEEYVRSISKNAQINCVLENVKNPVLSKLKVNIEGRYTL